MMITILASTATNDNVMFIESMNNCGFKCSSSLNLGELAVNVLSLISWKHPSESDFSDIVPLCYHHYSCSVDLE